MFWTEWLIIFCRHPRTHVTTGETRTTHQPAINDGRVTWRPVLRQTRRCLTDTHYPCIYDDLSRPSIANATTSCHPECFPGRSRAVQSDVSLFRYGCCDRSVDRCLAREVQAHGANLVVHASCLRRPHHRILILTHHVTKRTAAVAKWSYPHYGVLTGNITCPACSTK